MGWHRERTSQLRLCCVTRSWQRRMLGAQSLSTASHPRSCTVNFLLQANCNRCITVQWTSSGDHCCGLWLFSTAECAVLAQPPQYLSLPNQSLLFILLQSGFINICVHSICRVPTALVTQLNSFLHIRCTSINELSVQRIFMFSSSLRRRKNFIFQHTMKLVLNCFHSSSLRRRRKCVFQHTIKLVRNCFRCNKVYEFPAKFCTGFSRLQHFSSCTFDQ